MATTFTTNPKRSMLGRPLPFCWPAPPDSVPSKLPSPGGNRAFSCATSTWASTPSIRPVWELDPSQAAEGTGTKSPAGAWSSFGYEPGATSTRQV